MLSLFINIMGVFLIILILWWFIFHKPAIKKAALISSDIEVKDGIYQPSVIKAEAGKPIVLTFIRKDHSPCAAIVTFDSLGLSAELPVNSRYQLKLPPLNSGSYEFTCQMGMYRGMLIVK